MYLSRVRVDLNGLSRTTLFEIMNGEAYGAHQLLWQAFPGHDGSRPFLFRQELDSAVNQGQGPQGLPLFYVLSDHAPVSIAGLLNVQSKPFSPALCKGERLAFRLRANPTVAQRTEGAKRSLRSDVLMAAKKPFPRGQRTSRACVDAMDQAARDWLLSRAEDLGFQLPAQLEVDGYRQHALKKPGRCKEIQFSTVDYEGLLEVVDPGRLVQALAQGIGRAKAFGCGLMLLRRV